MSLQQFDEAFAKNTQSIKAQYEEIELQIEKLDGVVSKIDPKITLQTLVLKKMTILQEEKQFWCQQRQKGKDVSSQVAERVQEAVKEGIQKLQSQELAIATNSIWSSADQQIEEEKHVEPNSSNAS